MTSAQHRDVIGIKKTSNSIKIKETAYFSSHELASNIFYAVKKYVLVLQKGCMKFWNRWHGVFINRV